MNRADPARHQFRLGAITMMTKAENLAITDDEAEGSFLITSEALEELEAVFSPKNEEEATT